MPLIFVYITNPTKAEARKIALHLLKKKLVACAVVFGSVDSMYWWKGKVADEKEFVLICKTHSDKYDIIVKEVENMHSYDIPCIIKIPVNANRRFDSWLKSCLKE